MLIYNLDRSDVPFDTRLVNGSRGVVCELVSLEECQLELDAEDRAACDAAVKSPNRSSVALALAGTRRDSSAAVTLSRAAMLKHYCDHPCTKLRDMKSLVFPRVQFINGVRKLITPCYFSQSLYNGGEVFRLQLPIKCTSPLQCISNDSHLADSLGASLFTRFRAPVLTIWMLILKAALNSGKHTLHCLALALPMA
jgi:hypothetical protein